MIIAASKNEHKIREIGAITRKFGLDVVSRDAAGIDPDFDIVEDGETFEENSMKKAEAVMELGGQIAIADDSGLMVDILDGAPGVYSARFSGDDATDESNNEKLLALMADVPEEKRTARFVSVISMAFPDGRRLVARGECPGRILFEPQGDGGFGYDPLFLPDGSDKTFAQMTDEEKNGVSHRAKALERLEELLREEKL